MNEAATIADTINTVRLSAQKIEDITFDILVINDGSEDSTAELASEAGAIVVSHLYNQGVGAAFQTMISYTLEKRANFLVTIDADLQFNPEEITNLLKPVLSGQAVMATGSRFEDDSTRPEHMSATKYVGNKIIAKLVSKLVGKKFHDVSCGFRAYSQEALLHLNLHGDFTYTQETFINLSLKRLPIVALPITVKYFPDRKSRVVKSILNYAMNSGNIILRTYRDYRPMRFFLNIALLWGIVGILTGGFSLIRFFLMGAFSPYISIAFIAAFSGAFSIIFIIVALIADMYSRLNHNQERIIYMMKKERM